MSADSLPKEGETNEREQQAEGYPGGRPRCRDELAKRSGENEHDANRADDPDTGTADWELRTRH